jgi:hypothetical protein
VLLFLGRKLSRCPFCFLHLSNGERTIIIFHAEPSEDIISSPEDLAHELDLVSFFRLVFLVDADLIDPEQARFCHLIFRL